MNRIDTNIENVPATESLRYLRENRVISLHPLRVDPMEGEEFPAHGDVGEAKGEVAMPILID
jgi:hypothetical protein